MHSSFLKVVIFWMTAVVSSSHWHTWHLNLKKKKIFLENTNPDPGKNVDPKFPTDPDYKLIIDSS